MDIYHLILLVILLTIVWALSFMSNKIYFNSNVDHRDGQIDAPKFEVIGIKKTTSTEGRTVAEYTILNCFFSKKGCKGWKYNKFTFYDKPDMYKIGDMITFTAL